MVYCQWGVNNPMATSLIKPRKRGVNPDKLSDQQMVFVHELAADECFNASAAARKAGYNSPGTKAGKLLKLSKIQAYLGVVLGKRMLRCDLTGDRVLLELKYLAFRDPIDLCDENGCITVTDLRQIPERMRRCIDSIKVKERTLKDGETETTIEVKLSSKIAALELAMKHCNLLAPQEIEVGIKNLIDWEKLYEGGSDNVLDPIEAKIAGVEK